jgi:aspartate aminotransferase
MLEHISDDFLEGVRREFCVRRETLYDSIRQIPDVVINKPQGAFYTLVHLPVPDTDDFAAFLLDSFSYKGATAFIAPAAGFYMQNEQGRQKARIAYVLKKSDIEGAVEALAAGLARYLRR